MSIQYASQQYGKQHILWWLSGHRHSINSQELIACQKTLIYHGLQMNRGNYLFLRNISKAPAPQIFWGPVWLELKVALKTNKCENEVAHFDCTMTYITSLFNWQAIIITDQPGNTIVSVIQLVHLKAIQLPFEILICTEVFVFETKWWFFTPLQPRYLVYKPRYLD